MLKIDLITRDFNHKLNSLTRYDQAIYKGLTETKPQIASVKLCPVEQGENRLFQLLKKTSGLDVATFLKVYPLGLPDTTGDLAHLTNFSHLSGLWRSGRPVVATVHDIIHYANRENPRICIYSHLLHALADRLAIRHLRHLRAIIASSEFTRRQLIEHAGVPGEKIKVVHLGIDHSLFRLTEIPQNFLESYNLHRQTPYVLHISTEEPRKNFESLLRAWPQVRQQHPSAVLLKVGPCYYPQERQRSLALIKELGLGESVRFIESVPEADLPLFYNLAQIFAFPSLVEGFGFPVLEAMACGTAVVCSNTPALAEIVGAAALQHEPTDVATLARQLCNLLGDQTQRGHLTELGLAHVAQFTWSRTVDQTWQVYRQVLG